MTNQPTSNPPPGGKKTPKSKSVFNKFKSFAKKVSRPSTKDDYSVVNAIAAVQVENSRILNRAGRFVPDGPIIAAPGETLGHSDSQGCSKDFSAMPGVQLPKNLTSRDAPDQSDNLLLVTTASEEMEDINRSLTTVSTSFNYTTQQTLPPARQMTFSQNVPKPVFRVALPEAGDSSISTLQLAFGLHLLSKNPLPSASISELLVTSGKNMQKLVLVLDKDEEAWKSNVEKNSAEQVHVHWLTTRVAIEFLNCPYKDVESIVEVVLLGSALEPKIYQKVVSSLIGQLGSEGLLVPDLLQGLMQLIQEASPGSLTDSELVRILRVLREQLTKTYKELGTAEHAASKHIYQLSTIICRVLDAMMVGNIRALNRTEDYKALLDLLLELKGSPDSYLKFQASYAWQALQYAGDDEPPLHTILRIGGGVTMAALSVASIFKFDPENLFKGLDTLAQAAGQAFDVVKAGVEGAQALRKGGEGVIDSLLKGFRSGFKRAWYPALLAARMCVRDGRVADFEQIIYEAPCRREPEFQWGVCQLLGEIAMDPIWAIEIRQQAVDLLGKLYWSDEEWITDAGAKQAILGILRYISINAEQIIQDHTRTLLQDLTTNSTGNLPREYPLTIRMSLPGEFPLRDKALMKLPLNYKVHMMIQSREKYGQPIYILPQAKANLSAADEESFSLMDRVKEFLNSNQQVFLLLGDSGAGKSKFNKHLEHVLCAAYKPGYQIPLFINLPDLENPEKELIMEGLKKGDFSNAEILQLKRDQQFILICDGYDEAQLSNNLHYSNKFNCSGQWNVKMIISCRSTYLEQDYRDRFQPRPIDVYSQVTPYLFQVAVIVPFSRHQIEDYVEQFVQEKEVHELDGRSVWSAREYLERLAIIPNLMQLVKNPFLLNMTLKILPVVAKGTSDISKIKMTRLYVYHSFIDEFVELGKRRLLPMPLEAGARDILLELIDEGFSHAVIKFLKNLAAAIFQEQDGNPFVQYNPGCDAGSWKARFFGRSKKLAYLRESSPLTRAGAQHSFIHTSLLEYFYSRHVFDAEASLDIARHPLSQRNLVKEPSIIQFLAEYVQGELGFKQRLLQIIERSKTDVTASQAAANAITILVRAGVLFNGADLKGAQIPGADLSGGQFDSAQLQGSDLSRTNMRSIWLRQANLTNANLDGVEFGELPHIELESSPVHCCFSNDGTLLAIIIEGAVAVYDTTTWKKLKTYLISGSDTMDGQVAFSPLDKLLAVGLYRPRPETWHYFRSARSMSSLFLLDVSDMSLVRTLDHCQGHFRCLAFSPNNPEIASAIGDTVRVWNTHSGELVRTFHGDVDNVNAMKYSLDGNILAAGDCYGIIYVWNARDGSIVRKVDESGPPFLYRPQYDCTCIKFSPSSYENWTCVDKRYDLSPWYFEAWQEEGPDGDMDLYFTCLSTSFDGQFVVSGTSEGRLKLWNPKSGQQIDTFLGHSDYIQCIAFHPKDDKLFVSLSRDKKARLWYSQFGAAPELNVVEKSPVKKVTYHPKSGKAILLHKDGLLKSWHKESGEFVGLSIDVPAHMSEFSFSLDGRQVLLWADGELRVRNWEDESLIYTFQFPKDQDKVLALGQASQEGLYVVSFTTFDPSDDEHPSCNYLVLESYQLWDTRSQTVVFNIPDAEGLEEVDDWNRRYWTHNVEFSPEGSYIACQAEDGLQLWDISERTMKWAIPKVDRLVVISPDGSCIACRSGSDFQVWNIRTRTLKTTISDFDGRPVSFSPDSLQFSLSNAESLSTYNTQTGSPIIFTPLNKDSSGIRSIEYSPCGKLIVTLSNIVGEARLWRASESRWNCVAIVHTGLQRLSVVWSPIILDLRLSLWDDEGMAQEWEVKQSNNEYFFQLCWSTHKAGLNVDRAIFQGTEKSLDTVNRRLLQQREARFMTSE